ncbi:hypothetical protein [Burkholderia sp. IMCC1007]|nr:hypothetical protein [Burkholderia sp. IMCC1007]
MLFAFGIGFALGATAAVAVVGGVIALAMRHMDDGEGGPCA